MVRYSVSAQSPNTVPLVTFAIKVDATDRRTRVVPP